MPQQAVPAPLAPVPEPAEQRLPPGLPPRRWASRHTYGAIDLGTNNCRLLVARPTDEGFTVIDAFSRVVRLGEGMATSRQALRRRRWTAPSPRSRSAPRNCSAAASRLARSVATEACRRAVNGRHFVERVRRETGICLEIIAPEEEARLAMLGCHRLLEPGDGPALIFDIGGGSTELVLIDTDGGEPRIKCWWSAPWGVVSLTESEGRDFATAEERLAAYGRMRERVRHAFRHFVDLLPARPRRHPADGDERHRHHPGQRPSRAAELRPARGRRAQDAGRGDARRSAPPCRRMDHAERAKFPCIGHERADLVVAGCAILEAIMDIWPAETLGRRRPRHPRRHPALADGARRARDMSRSPSGSGGGLRTRVKTARGRKIGSTRWLERQLNDPYVKRAKAEGYRSRAAYKLIELDERFGFLKGAKRVVDLGIAPGGWTQVVRQRLPQAAWSASTSSPPTRSRARRSSQMDFMDDAAPGAARARRSAAPPTSILSDMAANTVGHPQTDHLRTMGLVEAALDFAGEVLRPGGAFVAKVLAGGADADLVAELKRRFATVKHAKPPASRKGSSEWYVVAQGFKG